MTFAELLGVRADDTHDAIRFRESPDEPVRTWSWAEYVVECRARAALLEDLRDDDRPFHVGVLLDNVPEFPMWLGGAALAGATLVGINPTRRGEELARDIRHTDCGLIVAEPAHRPLLDGLDLGLDDDRVLDVDSDGFALIVAERRGAPAVGLDVDDDTRFLLLFTSGTTGAPKACICSQGRLARAGIGLSTGFGLGPDDCAYLAMPLFHSNALFAGWAPAVVGGMTMALRRRFSASGMLEDVRDLGVTYFNYVGKPLAYVLATPERPDDADNPLKVVFGNEAAEADIARFADRFGAIVVDSYGSTEGGAVVSREPDQPPGSACLRPRCRAWRRSRRPWPGGCAIWRRPRCGHACTPSCSGSWARIAPTSPGGWRTSAPPPSCRSRLPSTSSRTSPMRYWHRPSRRPASRSTDRPKGRPRTAS